MSTYAAYATSGDDAMVERIKPAGSVCVAGEPCEGVAVVASAASAGGAARSGEAIVTKSCFACHGTGAAGAPKIGDAAAWGPRAAKGIDTLLKHAMDGFNAMPPKGTCMDCSEEEIKGAIQYMVNKTK